MARTRTKSSVIPPLTNWGGVRSVQRRLERSSTIMANKEAVAYALICMGNTKFTDFASWDEHGNVTIKPSHLIPEHALMSIKSIEQKVDRNGNSFLKIEQYDKVAVLRILAKASGLLDNPDDGSEKPSVIDINVVAPRGET